MNEGNRGEKLRFRRFVRKIWQRDIQTPITVCRAYCYARSRIADLIVLQCFGIKKLGEPAGVVLGRLHSLYYHALALSIQQIHILSN